MAPSGHERNGPILLAGVYEEVPRRTLPGVITGRSGFLDVADERLLPSPGNLRCRDVTEIAKGTLELSPVAPLARLTQARVDLRDSPVAKARSSRVTVFRMKIFVFRNMMLSSKSKK